MDKNIRQVSLYCCPSCQTMQNTTVGSRCPHCGHEIINSVAALSLDSQSRKVAKTKEKAEPPKKTPVKAHKDAEAFPYQAELERRIYSHLLSEEIDDATWLQARVECGDDKNKTETTYYKLRYRQIVESVEIEVFKKELLAEKREKP